MCNKSQRHQPAFIMKTWGCSEGGGGGGRESQLFACVPSSDVVRRMVFSCLMLFTFSLSLSLLGTSRLGSVICSKFVSVFCQDPERTLSLGTSILRFTYWSSLYADCRWIPTAGWPHRTRCSHRTQKTSGNAQSTVLNLVDVDHPERTPCFTHAQTC